LADTGLFGQRDRIAEMALMNRLPGTSDAIEFAEAGFLFAYGTRFRDLTHQSAFFVDRILKGAKPVEQPIRFALEFNLKTSKVLGLEIPPSLLMRADEVIE
jgi:putative ABC transport system substrate-binding protein